MLSESDNDVLRACMRRRGLAPRTEGAYLRWMQEFLCYHGPRFPGNATGTEVSEFLDHLTTRRRLSASSRNQAQCALACLYRHCLPAEPPGLDGVLHAPRLFGARPAASVSEVRALLSRLDEPFRLAAELLFGSRLRLGECLSLRVGDIDCAMHRLTIRSRKGEPGRLAVLPVSVLSAVTARLKEVTDHHQGELAAGRGEAPVPLEVQRATPEAARALAWQFLFPASRSTIDPTTGRLALGHLHETSLQRAVRFAARRAEIEWAVSCETLRHGAAAVATTQAVAGQQGPPAPSIPASVPEPRHGGTVAGDGIRGQASPGACPRDRRADSATALPAALIHRGDSATSLPVALRDRTDSARSLPAALSDRSDAGRSLPVTLRDRADSAMSLPVALGDRADSGMSLPVAGSSGSGAFAPADRR